MTISCIIILACTEKALYPSLLIQIRPPPSPERELTLCSFCFLCPPGVKIERYSKLSKARPFMCTCGKSYCDKGSLKRHQEFECGKDPSFICTICGKGIKQKANFQRHYATVHGHLVIGGGKLSSSSPRSPVIVQKKRNFPF